MTAAADARYYERLGLHSRASHHDVVRAYRRLVLDSQPDARLEYPDAPRRFQEITEAYEVPPDPLLCDAYDAARRQHMPRAPRGSRPARASPYPVATA